MKLWVDAQLPPAIAPWIAAQFHIACVHVRETGLGSSPDEVIFRSLRDHPDARPVVLTKDDDFVDLVTRLSPPPQELWLRVGNVTNRGLREFRPKVLPQAITALESGVPLVELSNSL